MHALFIAKPYNNHKWTGPICIYNTKPMTQHNIPNNLPLCVNGAESSVRLSYRRLPNSLEHLQYDGQKSMKKRDIPPKHVREDLLVCRRVLLAPMYETSYVL